MLQELPQSCRIVSVAVQWCAGSQEATNGGQGSHAEVMTLLTEVMKLLNPFSATLASTPASPEGGPAPGYNREAQNPFSRAPSGEREPQDLANRHAMSPMLSAELPSGLKRISSGGFAGADTSGLCSNL